MISLTALFNLGAEILEDNVLYMETVLGVLLFSFGDLITAPKRSNMFRAETEREFWEQMVRAHTGTLDTVVSMSAPGK